MPRGEEENANNVVFDLPLMREYAYPRKIWQKTQKSKFGGNKRVCIGDIGYEKA